MKGKNSKQIDFGTEFNPLDDVQGKIEEDGKIDAMEKSRRPYREQKTEKLIIKIEPSLKFKLIAYADSQGISYADVIRASLREFLKDK